MKALAIDLGLIILGMLVIIYSRKMMEANARLYPRLYKRGLKVVTLIGNLIVGGFLILVAVVHLLAR